MHGACGEHLVLGELLRKGIEAYLAHGPTHKGWDILVRHPDEKWKKVEVKTIDWPDRKAVQINLDICFDVLIIVLLDKKKARSRFLVLAKSDVESHPSHRSGDRRDNNRTLTISSACDCDDVVDEFKYYEDKWDKIGL